MSRLEGKVALITGAARGQGRAHAVALAREGAQIVAVDICAPIDGLQYDLATPADLLETARLVEAEDQRCVAIEADARSSEQMRAAADRAVSELGHLDIGVINHGIVMSATWDQLTDQDWDTMIETNLSSVWRATRAVIPHLVDRGGGSIVITASAAGLVPFYGLPSYVAAKHGVIGLVKALATELAPLWIRVNAICPGNVSTPMFHNQYIYDMYAGRPGGTVADVEFPTKTVHMMPISWIEPEDVSHAVVFLASDDGKYVTGVAMPIDGGMTIQPPGVPPIASTRLAELSAATSPAP